MTTNVDKIKSLDVKLIDHLEERLNSKTQSLEQVFYSFQTDSIKNDKQILNHLGGIDQHLAELNSKTNTTIKNVGLNQKDFELHQQEYLITRERLEADMKPIKWAVRIFLVAVTIQLIQTLTGVPIVELMSLI